MRLDRVGQAPAQTGFGRFQTFAELQYHAALRRVDDVKPGSQPDHHDQPQQQPDTATEQFRIEIDFGQARSAAIAGITAALFLAHHATQLAVEITPQFFQIRRTIIRSTGFLAAGIIAVTPITPLWIVDGHEHT